MKKKIVIIISLLALIVLICVLSFIAMKPAMQINMAFNLEKNQFYYDFAVAFLAATEGMRGMTRYEQIEYISKNDFESHIQNMQGIIDRRILALRKWEKEFGKVYSDPFHEMVALVALEHAYRLFGAGFDKEDETDNEEWLFRYLLFIPITSTINSSLDTRDWRGENLENPPFHMWVNKDDALLTDFSSSHFSWERFENRATLFLDDVRIPEENKTWVRNYMQSGPYYNVVRRLREQGIMI